MRWTPFVIALIAVLVPLRTASAGAPPPQAPVAGFAWPLAPPHPVLRPFQAPSAPWGPGHRGVDLGGQPGDPVFAVADGVVEWRPGSEDPAAISLMSKLAAKSRSRWGETPWGAPGEMPEPASEST